MKPMFLSSPVTVIILTEIVFVLLVAIFLLGLIIRRQRQHQKFLLTEYRKIRHNAAIEFGPTALNKLASPSGTSMALDPVGEFFIHAKQDALVRFQKTARAKLPRLSPDLPFSAKVAALRYFYIEAEQTVHQQQSIRNEAWMTLERNLCEIIRWIEAPPALRPTEPDSRIRKLQEAIDNLSAVEAENIHLRTMLESSQANQQQMTEEQRECKDALARMQRVIEVLQLANTYKGEKVEVKTQEALLLIDHTQQLSDLDQSYHTSTHQLDNIAEISARKYSALQSITDNLPYMHKGLSIKQQRKLKGIINALKRDLVVSDNQIAHLQNLLKTTRDSVKREFATNEPVTPFNRYSSTKLKAIENRPAPLTKDILTIIHNSEKRKAEDPPSAWDIQDRRQQTLAEIEQLRLNNQNQRNMIIDLDKELHHLRSSLCDTTDKPENLEITKNIERLERLVSECESYIEILEHQVNSLHHQLKTELNENSASSRAPAPDEEPLQKLQALSHQLRQAIKFHSDMGILNRFYLSAINCQSLEALSNTVINSFKDLRVCAGFFLHSSLGKAEFYQPNEFTINEQTIMRQAAKFAPITRSKGRTLFARPKVRLMLKGLLSDDDLQHHLEQTLNNIAQFVDHHITHIEILSGHHQQVGQARRWINYAKSGINELDMQYAFQAEGIQIVNNLVNELKRAASTTDMSEGMRTVFNNAIGECHQRLQLLLKNGQKVEQVSTELHKALDQLNG